MPQRKICFSFIFYLFPDCVTFSFFFISFSKICIIYSDFIKITDGKRHLFQSAFSFTFHNLFKWISSWMCVFFLLLRFSLGRLTYFTACVFVGILFVRGCVCVCVRVFIRGSWAFTFTCIERTHCVRNESRGAYRISAWYWFSGLRHRVCNDRREKWLWLIFYGTHNLTFGMDSQIFLLTLSHCWHSQRNFIVSFNDTQWWRWCTMFDASIDGEWQDRRKSRVWMIKRKCILSS